MTKEEFFALGGTQENLNDTNFSIEEFMTDTFDHQELSVLYSNSEWLLEFQAEIQNLQDCFPYGYCDEFKYQIDSLWKQLSYWEDKADRRLFGIIQK